MQTLAKLCSSLIAILTGEWILTRGVANGAGPIAFRTAWSTLCLGALGLAASNLIDPDRSWHFSAIEFRRQLLARAEWFGAIAAGTYASYYARYARQWEYLAGVYNQIKAAETREGANEDRIAEWKAAFIEDALALHLAMKPMFVPLIKSWLEREDVRSHVSEHINSGRLAHFLTDLKKAAEQQRAKDGE